MQIQKFLPETTAITRHQSFEERVKVLDGFRSGEIKQVVTTNGFMTSIDSSTKTLIQFDLPKFGEDYYQALVFLHNIGRLDPNTPSISFNLLEGVEVQTIRQFERSIGFMSRDLQYCNQ